MHVTDPILNTAEASAITGVPAGTLRFWRYQGRGPRSFKLGGRKVGYKRSDVTAWLDQQYDADRAE